MASEFFDLVLFTTLYAYVEIDPNGSINWWDFMTIHPRSCRWVFPRLEGGSAMLEIANLLLITFSVTLPDICTIGPSRF